MSRNRKFNEFFIALWLLYTNGEKLDDGCGHALLGPESGVLSSKNYPGTYPNNTWCEWHIQVSAGSRLSLVFGDLDIEAQDCQSNYVKILKGVYGREQVFGEFCGNLKSNSRHLHTDTNELIIQFRSGRHISGRGFLLSYSTADPQDQLTCLDKGSYFSAKKYRKYCPAGCRDVVGEVSGDVSQGYRHTSVLCKAAVHAGVIQDEAGGWVSVEIRKGLGHYPASTANGIQSKDGSLSDSLFTFTSAACKTPFILRPASVSASSWWQQQEMTSTPLTNSNRSDSDTWASEGAAETGNERGASSSLWVPEQNGALQWFQLDLGEKKTITGVLTTGSPWLQMDCYVKSYRIEMKEKSSWRAYTQNNSASYKVFEGNKDSLYLTRNNFHPPIIARFIRFIPLSWHRHIATSVDLLGCVYARANESSQLTMKTPPTRPKPPVVDQDRVKLAVIIVPTVLSVVLVVIAVCVLKVLYRRQSKHHSWETSEAVKTGFWQQIRQPFARHPSTEFTISYSSDKEPVQKLDLVTSTTAEYEQPLMGMGTVSRKGSTFRPSETSDKEGTNDPVTHYDYLQTANQYALPLTNQGPEYATPIVERHAFQTENFTLDPGNYSTPVTGQNKSPIFRASENAYRKAGLAASAGYRTPQVKRTDTVGRNYEGVYDCPKVPQVHNRTQSLDTGISDYQHPQVQCPRDFIQKNLLSGPDSVVTS